MRPLTRFFCALLLFALPQGFAVAQTSPSCKELSTKIAVKIKNLPTRQVTDGTEFLLDITVGDSRRSLSLVQILANGSPATRIQSKELLTFSDPQEPTHYSIPLSVTFGTGDSSHLGVLPNSPYSMVVFAYDDSPGGGRNCGHGEAGFRTGKQTSFAVVLGFNYSDMGYRLSWAQKDAEDVVNHLVQQLNVQPENIWLLTDDLQADKHVPKHVNIRFPKVPAELYDILSDVADRIDGNTPFYFYFSGHQFAPSKEEKQHRVYGDSRFLMLPQSRPTALDSLVPRNILEESLAQNTEPSVVIFDACFSGDTVSAYLQPSHAPFAKTIGGRPTGLEQEVAAQLKNQARMLSSPGDGESFEFKSVSNGLFTHFLLKIVDDGEGFPKSQKVLTVSQAYDYALDNMRFCSDPLKDKGHRCDVPDMMAGKYKQAPNGNFPGDTGRIPWAVRMVSQ